MTDHIPDMDAYAATLQKVMAEAVAQAEALQAEAAADREAAFADRDKTNDLLREWENKAQRAVEDDVPALHKQVEAELLEGIKAKLKNSGKPEAEVARLLEIVVKP